MDGDEVTACLTYSANMTNINYSCCDILVSEKEPVKDVHYKVNLLYSKELEYMANLFKQDRVIGGKHF